MSSTAIVFVVLIACVTGVVSHYISENAKSKRKAGDSTGLDETLAQLDAIEERVRVLERIVTENKFDLKREIDKL